MVKNYRIYRFSNRRAKPIGIWALIPSMRLGSIRLACPIHDDRFPLSKLVSWISHVKLFGVNMPIPLNIKPEKITVRNYKVS